MLPYRLGDVDDDQAEPERGDEGDQLALEAHRFLASQLAVQEAEVETHANGEADRRVDWDAEEGIESGVQVEEICSVRPEHDEFPMGDVDDLRDAPDDVQSMRDDGEDAAEQEAEHQVCEEERREVRHGLPGPWLTRRCTGTGTTRPRWSRARPLSSLRPATAPGPSNARPAGRESRSGIPRRSP